MPRLPFTGLLLLLAACGARTGLPVPSDAVTPEADAATDAPLPEDASIGPICSPSLDAGPVATCSSWRAGAEVDVSPGGTSGQMAYFTSVVPSGDGVLATWFALTDDTQPATWVTRRLGFDGVPLGPARDHLSFATDGGVFTNVMSLAANGCAFAGVVDDPPDGCRFLPLDGDGRETGAVVSPTSDVCWDLGAAAGGAFSMLEASSSSGENASVALLTVSASGQSGAAAKPLPGITSAVLSPRLVLRDGTFLLSTFGEVDSGALAIDMRHFAADGTLLAGPFPLSDTAYSIVYMAETSSGVLAAWMGDANDEETVIVAALDHDGKLRAPPAPVVASENDALYGFALASTPAGDGLVAWQSLTDGSSFDLQIQALAPDGTPRGAPTDIGTYGSLGVIRAVVSADGEKAVLLFTGEEENVTPSVTDGMRAVPLTCLP
jgi:hypothetical protein